ncbi:MAG: flagellar hook-basal body complex protein FliE [bacterium]|nr:flagellar hook-basal body complex protein FliE [bacterium]
MPSIDRLPPIPLTIRGPQEVPPGTAVERGGGFADTLKQFVSDVNEMQVVADDKTKKFATGEIKDIHEVMAATEEASISLMLLIELRNKALDAYKELMRTPV